MSNKTGSLDRLTGQSLSRRGLLRRALAVGLGAGALGLLQACAPAAAPSPTAAPPKPTTAPAAQPTKAAAAPAAQPTAAPAAKIQIKTVNPGFLTIAMNGDMPMTGVQADKIIGIDGEVIGMIAERLGLKAKPSLMEWSATIESVKTGRTDVMLGSMGWTKARAEVMCVTDAIYYTSRFLVQKKGAGINSVETLKGKSFGTVTGFTVVPEMKKVPDLKEEVKLYDTSDAVIRDIVAGRLDTAVLDGLVVSYLIQKNPDWGLEAPSMKPNKDFPVLTGRNHAVMGMNEGNRDLFHAVNRGIKWIWEKGYNKELLIKYGSADPSYLQPPDPNPRLGVDRDEKGVIIDRCKDGFKDYSDQFK
ncbi:MAG: amino acid ABC transporter substrate-binding protein [Chloroflexi bacterium]|nr:amino acid ABC transporter substrate-binding protein [Chloroflexota bacterium]